jgi:hypothetical protein
MTEYNARYLASLSQGLLGKYILLRLNVTASPSMHMYHPLGIHTALMMELTDVQCTCVLQPVTACICIIRGMWVNGMLFMLSKMYMGLMHVARQPCCMGRVIHVIHVSLRGTEMEGYIGHAHRETWEVSSSGDQTSALSSLVSLFYFVVLCYRLLFLGSQSVAPSLISL